MQFENENDVTPSVINMSITMFSCLPSVLEYNINLPEKRSHVFLSPPQV